MQSRLDGAQSNRAKLADGHDNETEMDFWNQIFIIINIVPIFQQNLQVVQVLVNWIPSMSVTWPACVSTLSTCIPNKRPDFKTY